MTVLQSVPVPASRDALAAGLRPEDVEQYRRELTGYCYRMLGSAFEAEDAVQDTMVRAWKAAESFEGRSAVRSWLYRIATNVCIDMQRGRQRRALAMDMGPASTTAAFTGAQLPESAWITPIPDARIAAADGDPADVAETRDTIRLAFVMALQHLPARQRAVLILREVLRWHATEVAQLLDTSVASVNSALQRARATLAERDLSDRDATSVDPEQRELLARFVDAFERYDMNELVMLLHDDVIQTMPPYDFWLQGSAELSTWMLGPGIGCKGSRMLATWANGGPAFGQYRPDPEGGHAPWSLTVVEISGDRIARMHNFLDTNLFAEFGLPAHL